MYLTAILNFLHMLSKLISNIQKYLLKQLLELNKLDQYCLNDDTDY